MAVISASDFSNWMADPVTKAFFAAINERVEAAKEVLATSAGIDPASDNMYRGLILGHRGIMDVSMEDMEGNQE